MENEHERLHILDMIENGQITAVEGIHLLEALSGEAGEALEENSGGMANPPDPLTGRNNHQPAAEAGVIQEPLSPEIAQLPFDIERWRRWWQAPLWIGIGMILAGALLMVWALQASGVSIWLFFAGVPFLLGVALTALAWQIPSAHWLHLRIEQRAGEWPQRIAISFPLPLRLAAWVMRNFGHRIPNIQGSGTDEIILALGKSASPENPVFIEVEEGKDGERVQIFIT